MNVIVKDSKRKHGLASPLIMALEPRMMFDGAAASDAAHAASDSAPAAEAAAASGSTESGAAATQTTDTTTKSEATSNTAGSTSAADQTATAQQQSDKSAETASAASTAATSALPSFDSVKEVVIVDGTVADWQTLVAGIDPSIPVIVLTPDANGRGELAELTAILSKFHDLDEIHLVSEGSSNGVVILGSEGLWSENLDSVSACLDAIRGALKVGGELSLYGCSIAATDAGKAFVDELAAKLGNDIAVGASTDLTGPTRLDGDWTLEYTTGVMDTVLPFTLQGMQDFSHCLGCTFTGSLGVAGATIKSDSGTVLLTASATYWIVTSTIHMNGQQYDAGYQTAYTNDVAGRDTLYAKVSECNNAAPNNTAAPAVSGGTAVGTGFTATTGTWADNEGDPITYSEQWQVANDASGSGAAAISGATGLTFTPTSSQAHKYIRVVVSASDDHSNTATANSAWVLVADTAPVNSVAPAITGTATEGQTLTTSNGTWSDADGDSLTYSRIWQRASDSSGTGATAIGGATATTYTTSNSDAGYWVRSVVTATGYGNSVVAYSAWTYVAALPPSVSSIVRASGSGTTNASQVSYTVTFSRAVSGVDTSDFTVTAASGTVVGTVASVTGSGTTYTVTVNSVTGDGALRLDLKSSGTGITGTLDSAAISGGYTAGATVTFDHTAPTITNVTLDSATYKIGQTLTATITVASDSDTYTLGSASINGRALSGLTKVNATTYTATYTVQAGDADVFSGNPSVSVVLTDGSGNSNTAYTTAIAAATTIDAHAPTDIALSSTTAILTAGSTVGSLSATDTNSGSETFTYALVSGSGGNDTGNGSFTITGNTLTVGGSALTAGTYNIYVRVTDAGGNSYDKALVITAVDAPAISSINRAGGSTVTQGSSGLDYTVTFNQTVDGVDASDFTVTKGAGVTGTPVITVTAGADGSSSYTVHVAGLSGDGTVRLDLNASGTGIVSHSNGTTAIISGFISGQTYTLDHTAPAITAVTLDSSAYKVGQTLTATITVSSDSDSYTLASGTINGRALTSLTKVNDTTYTATYTVQAGDTDIIGGHPAVSVVLTDSSGNSNTAYTTAIAATTTIDTHAPTDIAIAGSDTGTHAYSGLSAETVVGALSATDASTGESFTYTLSGADAAKFEVVGGALRVKTGQTLTASTDYTVTVEAQDLGGNTYSKTFTITGAPGPTVAVGGTAAYTERGTAVTVDSGLTLTANGSATMTGATVTISAGTLATGDTLSCVTTGTNITASYSGGVLTLSGNDTVAHYQAVLDSVTFVNSVNHDPTAASATRSISWQVRDQYALGSAATTTLTITPVNDAPSLSATGATPTYTEAGSAVALFSGSAISATEGGQPIAQVVLTVSGLADGASENLVIDGVAVALTNGTSGTTTTNAIGYSVSVSGTTATVTLTKTDSAANWQGYVNGLTYQDSGTGAGITAGNRVVTLTTVKDSGGTANGGVDTSSVSIAATVTVARLNHVPTLSVTTATPTFTEGGNAVTLFSGATVGIGAGDSGQSIHALTFTVSNVSDGSSEIIVVDGQNIALAAGSTTTTANSFIVTVSGAGSTKTVTITRGGDFTATQAQTLVNGLQYKNLSQVPTVATRVVTLTGIQDSGGGSDSATLTAHSDVTLVAINSAPTLTASGESPSYTVIGSTVSLFSGAALGTVETGQSIAEVKLTVSGLADGANEILVIDGIEVALTDGTSGTTATNTIGYSVSVTGTTATVTLTKADSAANWQGYVNGLGYKNGGTALPTGNRVVTLTQVKDDGGTANGGADTATLSVVATVIGQSTAAQTTPTAPSVQNPSTPDPTPDPAPGPTPTPPAADPPVTVIRDDTPAPKVETPVILPRDSNPSTPVTPVTIIPATFTVSTEGAFAVAVAAKAAGAPDALVVNSPIRNVDFALGQRISVTIPADSFASTRTDAVVTLTATRADGAALPGWLVFNPKTGTFEGTPPPGFRGVVTVKIVARDNEGRQAVQTFRIEVGVAGEGRAQPDGEGGERPGGQRPGGGGRTGQTGGAGDRVAADKPVGRPGLLEQLRSMSKEGRLAQQTAVVEGLSRLNKVA